MVMLALITSLVTEEVCMPSISFFKNKLHIKHQIRIFSLQQIKISSYFTNRIAQNGSVHTQDISSTQNKEMFL